MLLIRLSWPANEVPVLWTFACGDSRVKLSRPRAIVGSTEKTALGTEVAAPVRSELKTASLLATVTISWSDTAAFCAVSERSEVTPSER